MTREQILQHRLYKALCITPPDAVAEMYMSYLDYHYNKKRASERSLRIRGAMRNIAKEHKITLYNMWLILSTVHDKNYEERLAA
jgi:hypothetical protein